MKIDTMETSTIDDAPVTLDLVQEKNMATITIPGIIKYRLLFSFTDKKLAIDIFNEAAVLTLSELREKLSTLGRYNYL